jgi:hypothetical protein
VQALEDDDQVARLLVELGSLSASQPPMLTRQSFLPLIVQPSV